MVPSDLRYTKDHEWVRVDGEEAVIGITAYAADQLGDIVFVELPDVGKALDQFAAFVGQPETVNSDPYGEGWMVRVRLADPSQVDELLDGPAYDALIVAG